MESTNVQPRHTRDCLSSISTQESTMFFTSALMMTEDDLAPFGWCVAFLLRAIMLPDFTRRKKLLVLWMFCSIVNVVWLQNDMVGYIYFQLSCCRPLGSLYHTGTRALEQRTHRTKIGHSQAMLINQLQLLNVCIEKRYCNIFLENISCVKAQSCSM